MVCPKVLVTDETNNTGDKLFEDEKNKRSPSNTLHQFLSLSADVQEPVFQRKCTVRRRRPYQSQNVACLAMRTLGKKSQVATSLVDDGLRAGVCLVIQCL